MNRASSTHSGTPAPRQRDHLFQHLAQVGHAMSSPQRLRMLSILAHKERTVEELAGLTGQSIASTSAHLKVLRGACLVQSYKEGRFVHVALANAEVLNFWLRYRDFSAAQLPEAREVVQSYNAEKESLAALTLAELATELQHGRVTLLDLRPADEFEAGHLPSAVNIPYSTFADANETSDALAQLRALAEANAGKAGATALCAYCRGPFCVMAREGVAQLRKLGIPALRLTYSFPEWKAFTTASEL